MIKLGNTYFMFASMMTGWDPNENQYTTSTSLSSGWAPWRKFADSGSRVSYPLFARRIRPRDIPSQGHCSERYRS